MDAGLLVFVVDDDEIVLSVLEEILAGLCRVECFASAEACRGRLAEQKPDLLLLDLTLPGMDGYTFCRTLKDDWETQDIPVIFVSANDDIETRLRCYEAGGEDFILKPFEPVEIQCKLQVAERIIASKRDLGEQAGYARRTAMSAMTSMGELGAVLQFLSKSFACNDLESLAAAVLEATRQWDLQAAVQLRLGSRVHSASGNGSELPLEVAVLNHVRNSGRIFQFKSRCVFNYGNVTLLLNNMPQDDEERVGRIRDNAALLSEGAEARLRAIESELLARRRREGIEAVLPRVRQVLQSVQTNYRRSSFELTQGMLEFEQKLAKSFVSLGLTEEQEEFLTALTGEQMRTMIAAQDQGGMIVGPLQELADSLEELLRN